MKKLLGALPVLVLLLTLCPAWGVELPVQAEAALLMEKETGQVLYAKNEHQALEPASVTKVMTLLLVMEAIDRGTLAYDDVVTVSDVELKDTAFHYFLNVSDYRAVGEQEPYEFARSQVKDMMLNMKQVNFMKQVKEDLYQRAEKKDKIKYY